MLSGLRTYLAAIGLVGLAVYQLSVGEYAAAWASFMGALAAFGIRTALRNELRK